MPSFSPAAVRPISFISITSPSNRAYGILYQDGMVLGCDGERFDDRCALITGSSLLSRGATFAKIGVNQNSPNPFVTPCTYLPNGASYIISALLCGNKIWWRYNTPNPATGATAGYVDLATALNNGGTVYSRRISGYTWG